MKADAVELKADEKTLNSQPTGNGSAAFVVMGKALRVAFVRDEEWVKDEIKGPGLLVAALKQKNVKADIFSFIQRLPDTEPKFSYPFEWDNVAAIPVTTYQDWWEKKLPQVTRKSIRRGLKRGVTAAEVEYTDEFVRGVIGIHNDTQTRQGEPFTHYGKSFDVVKREYGTYPDESIYLGSYFEGELIGMIKMVVRGSSASIMQILSMTRHYDKRPTNILIAKAIEVCEQRKIPFLEYRKYTYGNKTDSSLTEFKRRNGFEKIDLPRYYIPLTVRGRVAMKFNLHLGLAGILPNGVINFLLAVRSKYYSLRYRQPKNAAKEQSQEEAAD